MKAYFLNKALHTLEIVAIVKRAISNRIRCDNEFL